MVERSQSRVYLRGLNQAVMGDSFPLPHTDKIIHNLRGTRYFRYDYRVYLQHTIKPSYIQIVVTWQPSSLENFRTHWHR